MMIVKGRSVSKVQRRMSVTRFAWNGNWKKQQINLTLLSPILLLSGDDTAAFKNNG